MLKSTRLQAIVLVAVGALLGYAVATGSLRLNWPATAAPPREEQTARVATGETLASCCGHSRSKGEPVALAIHNRKVTDKAENPVRNRTSS